MVTQIRYLLLLAVLFNPLFALLSYSGSAVQTVTQDESRFPGFKSGQYGLAGMIGQPISVRYQKWLNWKRAWNADLGYQLDEFLVFDANYVYYLLSEDDRWRMSQNVGTVMFSVFGGIVAGVYLGEKREEESQLGLRAGGGFEYLLPKAIWSLRLEVSPVLYLSGRTSGGLQGGIGITYYFDSKIKKHQETTSQSSESEDSFDDFQDFESDFDEPKATSPKPKKKKPRSVEPQVIKETHQKLSDPNDEIAKKAAKPKKEPSRKETGKPIRYKKESRQSVRTPPPKKPQKSTEKDDSSDKKSYEIEKYYNDESGDKERDVEL